MKVLVTGVAGFIGSNLADRLLSEGFRVLGIDNLSYGVFEQVPEDVEFHRLDIRDPAIYPLFEGVHTVFHLAAKNCISDCQADPVETATINVGGTVNVFEAGRRAGVRKVVYAESSALYEGSTTLPTPESDIAPRSFYSVSKLAGMEFAQAYGRYHGLNTTALRYFCVYGPRQDYRRTIPPVMSAFILNLLRGQTPVIYGDGSKARDFVYVDDVNDFHLQCIRDPRTDGEVFNLGSGTAHSVRDILALVSGLLAVPTTPLYKADLPGEAQVTLADVSKALALGWRARTSLREGLEKMIEHIRTHAL